ncbi:ScbA/BarX family gamma-butyrolactone biosynthesis protein [Streptomyces sp. BE147]|uniref:ScbA/BarX family gamma-butyrolactone biosynthesis protein n=1 Tax=Streptomyces sp. BE147 TaxID=3002524 RepID=UPI002E769BF3|nr:ScbA/BarX family gamma-butyrolactone biosynthesis protein [Streptomyces sp. BE147]MEE1737924.1 ScbA/BarX family gamma-butyrolactone biosynthesis protein [Streptomyces sp. BE147]
MPAHDAAGNCILDPVIDQVPQHYVHKSNAAEVYLAEWTRTGPDAFRIAANWPSTHTFYRAGAAFDPLLLCETIRQTFPLLCHAAYEVPVGHQLIWEHFAYRIDSAAYGADLGHQVELQVECFDLSYRGTRPTALSLRMAVIRGGVRVATARTRFTTHTAGVYRRLRGERADASAVMARSVPVPIPAAAGDVRRSRADDVVIGPGGSGVQGGPSAQGGPGARGRADGGRRLRVPVPHPIYFDHPVDHVPGMLLLEAAHQLTYDHVRGSDAGAEIAALDCAFSHYVELDEPCALRSEPLGPDAEGRARLRVEAVQAGRVAFAATVTTSVTAAGTGADGPAGDGRAV